MHRPAQQDRTDSLHPEKTGISIVAALHHMRRYAREIHPLFSRHGNSFANFINNQLS
jgi:hypothetical protein